MRRKVSATIDAVLRRSPAQPLFVRRSAAKIAVLAYHGVSDADRFAAQLDLLRRTATPVSLDEAIDGLAGRGALPPRAVLITFDDGDATVRDVAAPLLRERSLPAVAFIVSSLLDGDRPVWPEEVRQLVAAGAEANGEGRDPERLIRTMKKLPDEKRRARLEGLRMGARHPVAATPQLRTEDLATLDAVGISIGNHSSTHACLDRCSGDRIRAEVRDAHVVIERATGRPPRAFAYPNGDWDPRVETIVGEAGYRVGFMFDHRLSAMPAPEMLAVSRVRVNASDSLDRFETVVSGLHPAIHAVRTVLRGDRFSRSRRHRTTRTRPTRVVS
jgi:peptidoglycan/xylan/chitin deacetylase (PgdA/CDA1 family)